MHGGKEKINRFNDKSWERWTRSAFTLSNRKGKSILRDLVLFRRCTIRGRYRSRVTTILYLLSWNIYAQFSMIFSFFPLFYSSPIFSKIVLSIEDQEETMRRRRWWKFSELERCVFQGGKRCFSDNLIVFRIKSKKSAKVKSWLGWARREARLRIGILHYEIS